MGVEQMVWIPSHRVGGFYTKHDSEDNFINKADDSQRLWEPRKWCWMTMPSPAIALWILNFVALAGHLGIATAVIVEGVKSYEALDFPLYTIVATWHNITADGFTYTMERSEFGKLNLTVICALFSMISATAHLVIVVSTSYRPWSGWYYNGIARCRMTWRWVEYFFSAPLMSIALLLVGGIREVTIMLLVFVGQATTMTCGFLVESSANPTYEGASGWGRSLSSRLAPFWVGCLSMVPTWVAFIYAFYSNVGRAKERRGVEPPSWVYAIIWAEVALFTSFTFPILWYQSRHPKHYWKTELWYSVLSLVAKLVLNGTLMAQVFIRGRLDLSSDDSN